MLSGQLHAPRSLRYPLDRGMGGPQSQSVRGGGKKKSQPLYLIPYHAMKTFGWVEVSLHAFLTSALDGGKWSASCPVNESPVPTGYEAEWAPEPVWARWREEKVPAPVRNRTLVAQPIA